MTAATNPAPARSTERSSDPSMEEILASIRKIIADDQALPIDQRKPALDTVRTSEVEKTGDIQKAAPAIATSLSPAAETEPDARSDSDFDAWLSETAHGRTNRASPATITAAEVAKPARAAPAPATLENSREVFTRPPPLPPSEKPAPLPVQAQAPASGTSEVLKDWPEEIAGETASASRPETSAPRLSVVENDPAHALDDPDDDGSFQDDDSLDSPMAASLDPLLLSDETSSSVNSSFQALAQTMMLQNSGMIEDLIKQMLRPMLKQWLDDNLPTMVERLVRAEIERVARGGP